MKKLKMLRLGRLLEIIMSSCRKLQAAKNCRTWLRLLWLTLQFQKQTLPKIFHQQKKPTKSLKRSKLKPNYSKIKLTKLWRKLISSRSKLRPKKLKSNKKLWRPKFQKDWRKKLKREPSKASPKNQQWAPKAIMVRSWLKSMIGSRTSRWRKTVLLSSKKELTMLRKLDMLQLSRKTRKTMTLSKWSSLP